MGSWIVFVVVALPIVVGILWMLFDSSIVRIQPGELGLILVRGEATDRALTPGIHWVPALRRRFVEIYPSLEMSYRAGALDADDAGSLDRSGLAIAAVLGDRTRCSVSYTVRLRLAPGELKVVHNRYGNDGIWAAIRDLSALSVRSALNAPDLSVDDLFGPARHELVTSITERVRAELLPHGFEVATFSIDEVDLGRAGEVIQAAVRARLELERERAENEMRVERARCDAEVASVLAGVPADAALRYREADVWREVGADVAQMNAGLGAMTRRSRTADRSESSDATNVRESSDVSAAGDEVTS
jgi:regulator of protease activity HflC (stomatin/prohibitin superfamily)